MSANYEVTEHESYWTVPLDGKAVCRFLVDNQLQIQFFEPQDEETTIVIEGQFTLDIDGEVRTLHAAEPAALGPVFALFRAVVETTLALKNGKLEVKFREGAKISAMPHRDFESWSIVGARGLRIVCMPGGELAIWDPDSSDSSIEVKNVFNSENEIHRRSREINIIINLLQPDPCFQPIILGNDTTVFDVTHETEEDIKKKFELYFGASFNFPLNQPLWTLIDKIKQAFPGWPDDEQTS